MTKTNGFAAWLALFRSKRSAAEIKQLQSKLHELELRIQHLSDPDCKLPAPIVVEQIRIDRVVVDKIEYQNNFGALGIKELSGKLNIGANYTMSEGDTPMEEEGLQVLKEMRSAMGQAHHDRQSDTQHSEARAKFKGGGPEVNIRAKTGQVEPK